MEERAVKAAIGFAGAAVLLALAVGAALLAADIKSNPEWLQNAAEHGDVASEHAPRLARRAHARRP